MVFNVLKKKKGEKEAVLFARSATAGGRSSRFTGASCWSDLWIMEESLRGGLASLAVPVLDTEPWYRRIWEYLHTGCHRDGVHSDCFLPHFQTARITTYRVPWAYDEEAVDVVRYSAQQGILNAVSVPQCDRDIKTVSRWCGAWCLRFTEDKNCAYLATQYVRWLYWLHPIFRDDSIAVLSAGGELRT